MHIYENILLMVPLTFYSIQVQGCIKLLGKKIKWGRRKGEGKKGRGRRREREGGKERMEGERKGRGSNEGKSEREGKE